MKLERPDEEMDPALENMLDLIKSSLTDSINHSKQGNDARRKLDPQSPLLMNVLQDEHPELVEEIHKAFQITQQELIKAIQDGRFDEAVDIAWDLQEKVQSMVFAIIAHEKEVLEVEALTHWVTTVTARIESEQHRLGE